MACAPLNPSTRFGALTLNGVSMHTAAWDTGNVWVLWTPLGRRGTDVMLPGAPGVLPMPRRLTATTVTLELVIGAAVDHLGAPYDSDAEALEGNVDYLRANVTDPFPPGSDPDTGTITAQLTMPSGAVRSGQVTVEDLVLGDFTRQGALATLDLTVPLGVLVAP